MFDERFISPFTTEWEVWNDRQAPDTYSHYGDIAMETLLLKVQQEWKKKQVLNYSYLCLCSYL